MDLHKHRLNRAAKRLAIPLSRIACSAKLHKSTAMLDAYLNFLLGKGAGTGWRLTDEVSEAVSRIHSSRPVVFDVGANVGDWSDELLRRIPTARLIMFEPSPGCCRQISMKPRLDGATLVQAAVGEQIGRAELHFSSDSDGSASLHERQDTFFSGKKYSQIAVNVVTLDAVIDQEGIDFVDFIKMDIEGHELFALRGAKRAISERRVGALAFEFGGGNINSRTFFRQFWDMLTGAGFQLWRMTPSGKSILINEYYEDLEYFRGVSNYVAELRNHPAR